MDNNIDSKINQTRDGVTQIGRDLRTEAHSAIDKAADKVPPATDRLANSAHTGVDKVADGVEKATTSMAERGKQLSSAYKNFAESGRSHVRASPAISVLIAAAAGYGLSKLFNTRSK